MTVQEMIQQLEVLTNTLKQAEEVKEAKPALTSEDIDALVKNIAENIEDNMSKIINDVDVELSMNYNNTIFVDGVNDVDLDSIALYEVIRTSIQEFLRHKN